VELDIHESVHRVTTMKITNKMQLRRLIYYSNSAVHVSGDVFAHHQEHLTVFTVSGSVHPSCCLLVSRMSWNWNMQIVRRVYTTRYCKYSQVFLMMGGKHCPKHVEPNWNNKWIYIMHLVGYFHGRCGTVWGIFYSSVPLKFNTIWII